MPRSRFFVFIMMVVLTTFGVASAFAYDQQLTTTLYASGYSIRAANGTLIDRRNIMSELYLGAWQILPGSDDPYYKGPRLSIEVDLRVGGDYGVSNSEMSEDRLERFVPGQKAMYMEAVFAYLNIQGLAQNHLDMRLGRLIRSDTVGYAAFDGAEFDVYLPFNMVASGYWGYEVKSAKPFGYDNLALDGVDHAGRGELDDAYFQSLVDPESTMTFGAQLSMSPSEVLDMGVAFRQSGYGDKLLQRTVAGRVAAGNEHLRTFARVVLNPLLDRYDNLGGALREGTLVTEATMEVAVATGKKGWTSLGYELYRPVFSLDSIFNLFGQLGRRDVVLRYNHKASSTLNWALWSHLRFLDNKEVDADVEQDGNVIGGGGGAGYNYTVQSRRLSARASVDNELSATRLGLEQEVGQAFFDEALWLSVRASLWYVRDALYSGNLKTIGGYVLSAKHQFNEKTRAVVELENYYGADNPRFVLTALLQLDLWR